MPSKTILWQIHDDKPGHRNQLRGLDRALAESLSLEVHSLRTPSRGRCLRALWSKSFAAGEGLPRPDLIVGAGHSTHLAVLAARRAYGGKAIVLMKPSLPPALFDLCLIPEHDSLAASRKIITTRGVLNVIQPTPNHHEESGLFLIGGPSAAHGWSDGQILEQIKAITASQPTVDWQLTTSRRTPRSLVSLLASRQLANLEVTPQQDTTDMWVPQQLAQAAQVWVSQDSVSMVYEALTSGAAVGVLAVPEKRPGRVAAGVRTLVETGWATHFSAWQPGCRLTPPPQPLDEARRCAAIVCHRLLSQSAA